MKYELTTRALTTNDMGKDCSDVPTEEQTHMYLSALAEDIMGLSVVSSVERDGFVLTIEPKECLSHTQLKAAMKPFFSDHRFCQLRFVSLTTAAPVRE